MVRGPLARWWCALPLVLLMAGCGSSQGTSDCNEGAFERQLQPLRTAIEAEIGDAEASSEAACQVLPLGAKPCGGPWEYLVYSTAASDSTRLVALAEDYDRISDTRNRACGLASDCMLEAPPEVALEGGRCVRATP